MGLAEQANALAREVIGSVGAGNADPRTLSRAESDIVFEALTTGHLSDIAVSAFLVALRARGESAPEIAGAASAFLKAAIRIPVGETYDSCGTGGDKAGTINISTAAALVAAGEGIKMAKHGNRSVSSKSGSADVLEALGVPVGLTPEAAAKSLEENNFAFLFAPLFHPAIGRVMPLRKELATPTLFNWLGPILNPADLAGQLMGVADASRADIIAQTLSDLGRPRALVVNGGGLDEIALHAPTKFWEVQGESIESYELSPADLGAKEYELSALAGGDAQENARLLSEVLEGRGMPAHREAIAVNAGAVAYLAGKIDDIRQATEWGMAALDTGNAVELLNKLGESNA